MRQGVLPGLGLAFSSRLPVARDRAIVKPAFAHIEGTDGARVLLEDAFSIYSGRPDANTLSRLIITNKAGRKHFVNDNVWWKYTDLQCNYHGTYGWRPFFDSAYRQVDRTTWAEPFRYQVTREIHESFRRDGRYPKVPPIGFLPFNYDPLEFDRPLVSLRHPEFYSNVFWDEKTKRVRGGLDYSENTDYPLMNCISATDFLLWERDAEMAQVYLTKMDAFLEALRRRFEDRSGLLWIGTQGSQIEFCHNGFRYPGHTHVYLIKVHRNLVEVAQMAGRKDLADKYSERAEKLARKLPRFLEQGKWFVGGLKDPEGRGRFGTGKLDDSPSSYFDVWHNVNAVVLNVADEALSRSITEKIASVPALAANHLTLINYPARPPEEIDPAHNGFPPPGAHVNGGWWWMLAGAALYTYTRTQHPDLLEQVEKLLSDHHDHYSVDYYNQYGANKGAQWPERGHDSYSVTCAGAFGMLFRALLDLEVTAEALRVSPRLPQECARLKTRAPVYYAGKKIFFQTTSGAGTIRRVRLNGKPYVQHDAEVVTLPYKTLQAENLVEIERGA